MQTWTLEHNFNPLGLQYTDLQQVDVLRGNPTYNKSTND